MKLSSVLFVCPIVVVCVIAVAKQSKSSEVSNPDQLSNADLNHLISILDGDKVTIENKNQSSSELTSVLNNVTANSTSPKPTVIKKRIKIIKPTKLPTTESQPIKSTTLTPSSSSTTVTPEPQVVSSTFASTQVETTPVPTIDKRADNNIQLLKEITPPSQKELVQQLSLLNSLLTSIGDNATQSNVVSNNPEIPLSTTVQPVVIPHVKKALSAANPAHSPSLASLSSILTGSESDKDVDALAAALLGLGPSEPSNVAPRQTNIANANGVAVDTEAAKALSEFLLQAAAIENQNGGLKNIQNVNPSTPAASNNQVSSLVSLLGTLNAMSPPTSQQQGNSFQNVGMVQNAQNQPINNNNNALLGILESQRQQTAQANSLQNLFSQQSQSSSFDLGNLIMSQSQNSGGGIIKIGSGILSSIGSIGSSIFSTVSNIFSGSGSGGKPRVRGMDTRLGLGYRFGDAADAQIMWDVGPQLFTDPLKNEESRSPEIKRKSHNIDPKEELSSITNKRAGKQQDVLEAAKRHLQLHLQRGMQSQHLNQKQLLSSPSITPKKPLSLLDVWNVGKKLSVSEEKSTVPEIPDQLLTPPLPLTLDESDKFQIARNKNFKKRSSASLKHFYSKPMDDPLSGHSTLTEYERMLLTKAKDVDFKAEGVEEVDTPIRPRKHKLRRRPRPTHIDDFRLTEPEYGHDTGLSESSLVPKKTQKPFKERPSSMLPHKSRRRPLSQEKWNPRVTEDSEENERHPDQVHNDEEPPPSPPALKPTFKDPRPHRNDRERVDEDNHRENYEEKYRDRDYEKDDHQGPPRFREPPPHRNRDHDVENYDRNEERHRNRDRERDNERHHEREHFPENRPRPNYRPPPARDEFNFRPPHRDPESSYSESTFSYPEDEHYAVDTDDFRPTESRPTENSEYGPKERPYDDGSEEYGYKSHSRPKQKEHLKEEQEHDHQKERRPHPKPKPKPLEQQEFKEKQRAKFSLFKIFDYWVRKAHRMPPKNRRKPETEEKKPIADEDEPYERFTYKDSRLHRTRADDRLSTKKRISKTENIRFNRKTSRTGGIPYEYYQKYSPEINPEANDSFLRRNQVSNKKKEVEDEKLLYGHGHNSKAYSSSTTDADSQTSSVHISINPTTAPPSNSVMSFVRNYLSSKTSGNSKKNSYKTAPSITTLTQLLSNPSSLSPLKILPIRREKRPQKSPAITKLAIVDGKLQVVDYTTTTTEAPIVHIGKDMSLEELTQVLSAVKKGKKKLKIKVKKEPIVQKTNNKDDDVEDYLEEEEEDVSAQAAEDKVDTESKKQNDVDEEDYDDSDGLKGIFIDIESGEVDVLKPVAELTSFEPKKEEPPAAMVEDEYEDEDGDGIANTEMRKNQEIFSEIQKELKQNYAKMKKAHEKAEATQKRKQKLTAKGMDESVDVVSKYFDMIQDEDQEEEGEESTKSSPKRTKLSL